MIRWLFLTLALCALASTAHAKCTGSSAPIVQGLAGAPFTCDAGSTPQSTDIVQGGQVATGNTVGWTWGQIFAAFPQAGNPAGTDTMLQFNNAGLFGADASLTFNNTTKAVTASQLSLTFGATALTIPNGNASIGGTLGVTGGTTLTNPASVPTLTMSGNNSVMPSALNCGGVTTVTWMCMSGNIATTITSTAPRFVNWNFLDSNLDTVATLDAFDIEHIIAPNGNQASGGRVSLNLFMDMQGSGRNPNGLYTFAGQSGALRVSTWTEGNNGGTPTEHQGAATNFNPTVDNFPGNTSSFGTVAAEWDSQAQAAPTFTGTIAPGTSSITGSISGTTLTTTVGTPVIGGYLPSPATAGTQITGGSGTTWTVNLSQTLVSTAMVETYGTLTVSGVTGTIAPWMVIVSGAGVTIPTEITAGSGTTWIVDTSQTVGPVSMTSSSSFLQNVFNLFVLQSGNKQLGWLGPTLGLVFANQAGDTVGDQNILEIGQNASAFPLCTTANCGIVQNYPSFNSGTYPSTTGYGIDLAGITFTTFIERDPFYERVALKATGITSATRLTSDGTAANGWIQSVWVKSQGSGYLKEPAVSSAGCSTAPVLHSSAIGGSSLGGVGVYSIGARCAAEAAATVTGNAALQANVTGNTLNLPINSTNLISCSIAASDTGPGAIGWTITFTATMGATASTTAIVGSPSWTAIGTDAALAIAAPTADTTLGAINITVTPTAVTATVGGSCTITSSQQII